MGGSYDVTLSASSPVWVYAPTRDGSIVEGWNSADSANLAVTAGAGQRRTGVSLRRTQLPGSSVELPFTGSGANLCFSAGAASYRITLDDRAVDLAQVTPASQNNVCKSIDPTVQSALSISGLDATLNHKARIDILSTPNAFFFWGGSVQLSGGNGSASIDDTTHIDDGAAGWVYSPRRGADAWDTAPGLNLSNGLTTFTCQYNQGSFATYVFNGAVGVILRGNIWRDAHDFTVTLDSWSAELDATSGWEEGSTVMAARGGLSAEATHTLTVRNFNLDKPACNTGRSCCTGIDELILLKPGTASSSSTTGRPTAIGTISAPKGQMSSTGAIVLGVFGGLIGLALIVFLCIFALRRWRRRKMPKDDGDSVDLDGSTRPFILAPLRSYSDTDSRIPTAPSTPSYLDRKNGHNLEDDKGQWLTPPSTAGLSGHFSASSESMHSRTDSSDEPRTRLARQDLEEVLQFVASRMDRGAPCPEDRQPDDGLPRYS